MLPAVFLERLKAIVPPEHLPAVLDSFRSDGPVGVRVNTLKTSAQAARKALTSAGIDINPVDWYPDGFFVSAAARPDIISSDVYRERGLYLQNLSSMVPVLELDLHPGQTVLDLAAAPGSKTLQIAAQLGPGADIAAVEIVRKRFFKLKKNLADHGAAHTRVYLQDGRRAHQFRPAHFDRVLLDAPCSTEGRFVADEPRTFRYWSVRKIREMAHKQKQLIESAIRCAKPGGLVVYSTCSFAPEENEAVVEHALATFGDQITIEPTLISLEQYAPTVREWDGLVFSDAVELSRRIIPSGAYEAFFISRIRKAAD